MRVPEVPPTSLAGGCSIIDVQYRLDLKVDIPSAFDLKVSVPIIIGTIPLEEYIPFDEYRKTFVAPPLVPKATDVQPPSSDDAGQTPSSPNAPPSLDPALPPPTYNESVMGGANVQEEDEHTKGDFEFVPK